MTNSDNESITSSTFGDGTSGAGGNTPSPMTTAPTRSGRLTTSQSQTNATLDTRALAAGAAGAAPNNTTTTSSYCQSSMICPEGCDETIPAAQLVLHGAVRSSPQSKMDVLSLSKQRKANRKASQRTDPTTSSRPAKASARGLRRTPEELAAKTNASLQALAPPIFSRPIVKGGLRRPPPPGLPVHQLSSARRNPGMSAPSVKAGLRRQQERRQQPRQEQEEEQQQQQQQQQEEEEETEDPPWGEEPDEIPVTDSLSQPEGSVVDWSMQRGDSNLDYISHNTNTDTDTTGPHPTIIMSNTPMMHSTSSSSAPPGSLVEARAVHDESNRNLTQAAVVDPEEQERNARQKKRDWRRWVAVISIGFLLVLAIILIVVFSLLRRDDSSKESDTVKPSAPLPSSTATPASLSKAEQVEALLQDDTLQAIQANPSSPQGRAFDFVVEDPAFFEYDDWRIMQRFALVTFYYSTQGPTTWKRRDGWATYDEPDECQWYSSPSMFAVSPIANEAIEHSTFPNPCSRKNAENVSQGHEFQNLWLWANNLNGTIPRELYSLTSLRTINMDNQLTQYEWDDPNRERVAKPFALSGTLGTEIGLLSNLEVLSLANNLLVGAIPAQLGRISSLMYVGLPWNLLTGLGGSESNAIWPKLEYFVLWDNNFTAIPTELGRCSSLRHLDMSGSNDIYDVSLGGSIPTELGGLTQLTHFDMTASFLTGPIPTEIGNLSRLTTLGLVFTAVSGSIPTEIGRVSGLTELNFNWVNSLTGKIPSEIGLLTDLEVIFAVFPNYLTGTIPTEIGALQQLTLLSLYGIPLEGPLPSEFGNLDALEYLNLLNTSLTGTIPTEIGGMTMLYEVYLSGNYLSGTIPSEIGNLNYNLTYLYLDNNELTGTIPTEMANLVDIWNLTYPLWLWDAYPAMAELLLVDDDQQIAELIAEMDFNLVNGSLQELALHNNSFSGTVPFDLCGGGYYFYMDCDDLLCGCGCNCTTTSSSSNLTQANAT